MAESFLNGRVVLHAGDMLAVLPMFEENSIDACVCDPPYHLVSVYKRFANEARNDATVGKHAYGRHARGFMGKVWDGGDIAFQVETWAQVLRVLKPGAHLIAFSGTRTYHRMACAIVDAGFEIRDQVGWCYVSGFPKSHDVSMGIDRGAGAKGKSDYTGANYKNEVYGSGMGGGQTLAPYEAATANARECRCWGTALKPAWEPIVLARKPLSEPTVAANVLQWGTGALNIDKVPRWGRTADVSTSPVLAASTLVRSTHLAVI